MWDIFRRKTLPSLGQTTIAQVLLLIDWDNLFYGLLNRFGAEGANLESRLRETMKWIKKDVGELLGGHGFVFAPEHLTLHHQELCVKYGLKLIICPKKHLLYPQKRKKSAGVERDVDTVDETIMWFADTMAGHPNFKTLCLVSSDSDYVPMLNKVGDRGIKRAIIIPSVNSLARVNVLLTTADKNPATGKKMLLMLDKIAV